MFTVYLTLVISIHMDPLLMTASSRIGSNTLSVTMRSTLLSSLIVSGLRSSLLTLELRLEQYCIQYTTGLFQMAWNSSFSCFLVFFFSSFFLHNKRQWTISLDLKSCLQHHHSHLFKYVVWCHSSNISSYELSKRLTPSQISQILFIQV